MLTLTVDNKSDNDFQKEINRLRLAEKETAKAV
jgi:hypothetical protein